MTNLCFKTEASSAFFAVVFGVVFGVGGGGVIPSRHTTQSNCTTSDLTKGFATALFASTTHPQNTANVFLLTANGLNLALLSLYK